MKSLFINYLNHTLNRLFHGRQHYFEIRQAIDLEQPKNAITPVIQATMNKLLSNSEHRAIELSRKGIFACPKYIDLFDYKDDTRIK